MLHQFTFSAKVNSNKICTAAGFLDWSEIDDDYDGGVNVACDKVRNKKRLIQIQTLDRCRTYIIFVSSYKCNKPGQSTRVLSAI